jgi:hypothetical protein
MIEIKKVNCNINFNINFVDKLILFLQFYLLIENKFIFYLEFFLYKL